MPSESSTRSSSNSTPVGRAGLVPVAMHDVVAADGGPFAAGLVLDADGVLVDEPAVARCSRSTRLRISCERTTSSPC